MFISNKFYIISIHSYSGRHCCLFCESTSANMQLAKDTRIQSPSRNLNKMKQDLDDFRLAGDDIKNAKFHNNVIDDVMFNIEVGQVNKIN